MMAYYHQYRQSLNSIRNLQMSALGWYASWSVATFVLLCGCGIGSTALGHGDTHEQVAMLDGLLEENPDHVASLLERADLYRRHRDFEAALVDLNRVRLLSPTSNTVYLLTGLTLLEQGKFKEAESALQTFLGRSSDSVRGHVALAKVLTQQERYLSAAQAYELAIENQATPSPDHYLLRAHAYIAAGEPYLSRALEGLEEGVELLGPLITFQRLAIEIEIDQGKHQDAIERVNMILVDADRKESWLVKKASILYSIGRLEEAIRQFRLAERTIESLPRRLRTTPAIRALQKTINENLNRES